MHTTTQVPLNPEVSGAHSYTSPSASLPLLHSKLSLFPPRTKTTYTFQFNVYAYLIHLDRELARLSLVVPSLNPVQWTQRSEGLEENLAWLKLLALDIDAFVVVDIGLCAVLGLVLVGEPCVELGGLELECLGVDGHDGKVG